MENYVRKIRATIGHDEEHWTSIGANLSSMVEDVEEIKKNLDSSNFSDTQYEDYQENLKESVETHGGSLYLGAAREQGELYTGLRATQNTFE